MRPNEPLTTHGDAQMITVVPVQPSRFDDAQVPHALHHLALGNSEESSEIPVVVEPLACLFAHQALGEEELARCDVGPPMLPHAVPRIRILRVGEHDKCVAEEVCERPPAGVLFENPVDEGDRHPVLGNERTREEVGQLRKAHGNTDVSREIVERNGRIGYRGMLERLRRDPTIVYVAAHRHRATPGSYTGPTSLYRLPAPRTFAP